MKKVYSMICAAAAITLASGCAMCNKPISNDQSCIEASHDTNFQVTPSPLAFTAPSVAACKDVFQPVFRAGDKRFTVTGVGSSLEEATDDAVAKFIAEAKCDYIVAVSRNVTVKTHPTYRFFATKNYTVTFSGLPLYLDKLVKLQKEEKKVVVEKPAPAPAVPTLTKEDVKEIVNAALSQQPKDQSPFGLLKLSDINVQIQAKGATPDNVGVAFPAPTK